MDEAISYFLIQIQPFSIKTVNQINLPLSWTGLYLFLPHNSIFWIFKDLNFESIEKVFNTQNIFSTILCFDSPPKPVFFSFPKVYLLNWLVHTVKEHTPGGSGANTRPGITRFYPPDGHLGGFTTAFPSKTSMLL